MRFGTSTEDVISYVRQRHMWFVPAAVLLFSHLLFSVGGFLSGLVCAPLSYFALVYFAKHHAP